MLRTQRAASCIVTLEGAQGLINDTAPQVRTCLQLATTAQWCAWQPCQSGSLEWTVTTLGLVGPEHDLHCILWLGIHKSLVVASLPTA